MARGKKKKAVSRKAKGGDALDLSTMSLAALRQLKNRVDERITEAEGEEVARLRNEFESKAAKLGLSVSEIVGKSPRKRKARRASTKKTAARRGRPRKKVFVNPADSSLTWSGRGRRPRWINDFLAGGGSLDSLRG